MIELRKKNGVEIILKKEFEKYHIILNKLYNQYVDFSEDLKCMNDLGFKNGVKSYDRGKEGMAELRKDFFKIFGFKMTKKEYLLMKSDEKKLLILK